MIARSAMLWARGRLGWSKSSAHEKYAGVRSDRGWKRPIVRLSSVAKTSVDAEALLCLALTLFVAMYATWIREARTTSLDADIYLARSVLAPLARHRRPPAKNYAGRTAAARKR